MLIEKEAKRECVCAFCHCTFRNDTKSEWRELHEKGKNDRNNDHKKKMWVCVCVHEAIRRHHTTFIMHSKFEH